MNTAPIEVGVAVQPTFWLLRPHLFFVKFANFGEFLLGRGRVPHGLVQTSQPEMSVGLSRIQFDGPLPRGHRVLILFPLEKNSSRV
jgi:hypothetical protein